MLYLGHILKRIFLFLIAFILASWKEEWIAETLAIILDHKNEDLILENIR